MNVSLGLCKSEIKTEKQKGKKKDEMIGKEDEKRWKERERRRETGE